MYCNHYLCPEDGAEWSTVGDSMHNDRCPTCRLEIEPYAATEPSTGDVAILAPRVCRSLGIKQGVRRGTVGQFDPR